MEMPYLEKILREKAENEFRKQLAEACEPLKFLIRLHDYKRLCHGEMERVESMLYNRLAYQYSTKKLLEMVKVIKGIPDESA